MADTSNGANNEIIEADYPAVYYSCGRGMHKTASKRHKELLKQGICPKCKNKVTHEEKKIVIIEQHYTCEGE